MVTSAFQRKLEEHFQGRVQIINKEKDTRILEISVQLFHQRAFCKDICTVFCLNGKYCLGPANPCSLVQNNMFISSFFVNLFRHHLIYTNIGYFETRTQRLSKNSKAFTKERSRCRKERTLFIHRLCSSKMIVDNHSEKKVLKVSSSRHHTVSQERIGAIAIKQIPFHIKTSITFDMIEPSSNS